MTIRYQARVLRVIDGDTFTGEVRLDFFGVIVTAKPKFRLVGVDTPEMRGKERGLGQISHGRLRDLIEGQVVEIQITGADVFGRWLAEVYKDGQSVNQWLLREGLAERYSPEKHNDGVLDKD